MNISFEYRYTKKVSAFVQFNNLTGKKYQYWTNFPVQSINILGGVTFSF
jgi:outer membrane receptor protein involved in Fe transport